MVQKIHSQLSDLLLLIELLSVLTCENCFVLYMFYATIIHLAISTFFKKYTEGFL